MPDNENVLAKTIVLDSTIISSIPGERALFVFPWWKQQAVIDSYAYRTYFATPSTMQTAVFLLPGRNILAFAPVT